MLPATCRLLRTERNVTVRDVVGKLALVSQAAGYGALDATIAGTGRRRQPLWTDGRS